MTSYGDVLWEPDGERRQKSQMARFLKFAEERSGRSLPGYPELHQWSLEEIGQFWSAVAEFSGIRWRDQPSETFVPPVEGRMRGGQWFPGATLNFAENLLPEPSEQEVIVSYAEGRSRTVLTARELRRHVALAAAALKRSGVEKGDRVAGVMSNVPETIVAMLATTSLGAIWSSCSPDFGTQGVVDRFSQIDPKVVFFTSDYQYNGKSFDATATIRDSLAGLPSVEKAVVVDHCRGRREDPTGLGLATWAEYLDLDAQSTPELSFTPVGFDDPVYILYSSGTTGVPKCITHGVGGTLIQHKKELQLHSDLGPDGSLLYFTTCGWMMWNWMVSALSVGSRLVLYEGSPMHPDGNALWRVVADEGVTGLGISPKYLGACMDRGLEPGRDFALGRLRTVFSTGAPLLPEPSAWVYDHVGSDIHLASISGGTDIVSCFMLGTPLLPVRAGEIQYAGLGMAVEAWDDDGHPVVGQKGELVCAKPFPAMPVKFWNDEGDRRYTNAYFEHYAFTGREVWRHGDFIEIRPHGGIVIYGRSDATLNPGGVRIGTAEIYRHVESLPEVTDSLAVGRPRDGDVDVVLFVKITEGEAFDEGFEERIKKSIRSALTPRHVPREVVPVKQIPYTRSGKKVEMAVTRVLRGEEVENSSALQNPESIDEYKSLYKERWA